MKILYLHGWTSVVNGRKPRFLISKSHEVIQPSIPDDDFPAAVQIAEELHRKHQFDVIVGSSRGGAVAMNMNLGNKLTPLVLLCPAWRRWGTVAKIKRGTVVLHSPDDDVIPFAESVQLFKNSQLEDTRLLITGSDHRLADPKTLAAMHEACLSHRPRVMGIDFGAPITAGEQAKKIIAIEAVKIAERTWAVQANGRNERLRTKSGRTIQRKGSKGNWRANRPGWTVPEICRSLVGAPSVAAAAFDFPFSIPNSLMRSVAFAEACHSITGSNKKMAAVNTRRRWMKFVASHLSLTFDGTTAGSRMTALSSFDPIRNKSFWHKRATDIATGGSPPLKHQYQSLCNMTLCGAAMLERLRTAGYQENLMDLTPHRQSIFETYPRMVAARTGFTGSYKAQPAACFQQAMRDLKRRNITLTVDPKVQEFCLSYRTGNDDPDAADAFLCLVAAICFACGEADLCRGDASEKVLAQEGAIIVPKE